MLIQLFCLGKCLCTGAGQFIRVEPTVGLDPSLAGTTQQGAAAAAVGQGYGTEKGIGILHGVKSDTVGRQQLRQPAAVQAPGRRTSWRHADVVFIFFPFAGQIGRHHRQAGSPSDGLSGSAGGRSRPIATRFHSLGSK